ncbi:MAG: hypothetical protein ACYSUI_21110, partial [Planctomycetota bacterium]
IPATTVTRIRQDYSEIAEISSVRGGYAIHVSVNEAATKGGQILPGTRTEAFKNAIKGIPVHLTLSGRTMEFDGNAKCVAGC